jgi:RHS repeat-associated protein
VKQVDYAYDGGADTFNSPFAPERAGVSDARQSSNFAPHLLPTQRVARQTYTYDWLGSLSSADDDAHVMWDRGVGPITTYTSTGMPYRWKNAGDSALPSWVGVGAADALAYDETGNLLDLQVARTGTCTNGTTNCGLRFIYAYDEVGRLNGAKRIEGATTKADLRYTYDFSDDRTLKGDYSVAQSYFTAYVFDTLELRRTTYNTTTGDFAATALTETPFLIANDARIGRVVYEGASDGEPRLAAGRLHTFIEIDDPLGSTSVAIDKATGELAERITYQPYGATESDYRPDRWKGFREDYRFTGKEEDVEVGLTYFGKRFLSAPLGRWVSPDPLAVHAPGSADLNLYAYVHGRVLRAIDPLGLSEKADKVYGAWAEAWGQAQNSANKEKRGLEEKFRNQDSAAYAENRAKFDAGNRDALGAEYRAVADRYDAAAAALSQADRVHHWIECRIDGGEQVTNQQINEQAFALAQSFAFFQSYLAPLILAGVGGAAGPSGADKCFVAGTRVETSRGSVPIEEVAVGDEVLTFDLENGRWETHRVVETFVHTNATVQGLFLRSAIGAEAVTSTLEHPFWVIDKGWTPAKDLTVGDELLSAAQTRVVVVGGETYEAYADTYNFTVEGEHNYVVGDSQILVHNGCAPQDKPRGDARANVGNPKTEPQLPQKLIAEKGGVSVEHYYRSNDHPPAHAHVKGGGDSTRIGPNGKPLAGDPPLTARQQAVVDANKSVIRRALSKVGRWLNFHEDGG